MTCHFSFLDTHCQYESMLKLAQNEHCCRGIANVYTDGSYFHHLQVATAGHGVYIEESKGNNFKKHCFHRKCTGPRKQLLQYEREALLFALNLCQQMQITEINLIIDSHLVFLELLDPTSSLTQACDACLVECRVFLVFSHIGIMGNEIADRLANQSQLLPSFNTAYRNEKFSALRLSGLLKLGKIMKKQSSVTENIVPEHLRFNF